MQKLYAYVDENGQETQGRIFIVSVVVAETEQDTLQTFCELLEKETGKGKFKWGKAEAKRRLEYLRRAFADKRFRGKLCYSVFRSTRDYDAATIMGIERAIHRTKPPEKFGAFVYVDGLSKTKRQDYAQALRKAGIPIKKVQGVQKDENNALTRLADALAGFVRDALDNEPGEIRKLFEDATRRGVLLEV
jgi:hypothetical protein